MRIRDVLLTGVMLSCAAGMALAQTPTTDQTTTDRTSMDRMGTARTSTDSSMKTSIDRSFKPSPKDCADVQWSDAALRAYPKIASACQSVEQRGGTTYVMFEGTVEEVVDNGARVRIDFKEGDELTLAPPPNTALYLNGKRTPISALRRGDELNFYVPEDQLQARFFADATSTDYVEVPIVYRDEEIAAQRQQVAQAEEEERQSMAASDELPATASELPLLALSGAMLVLFGAGLSLARKWRR